MRGKYSINLILQSMVLIYYYLFLLFGEECGGGGGILDGFQNVRTLGFFQNEFGIQFGFAECTFDSAFDCLL